MSDTGGDVGRSAAKHARREEALADAEMADAPSDAALLDAVRDGDGEAFDAVYRRHVDAARRLARVLTRDHAEADDLVAESFARLLTTLKSGGGPESAVRAYVLTTMRRVHIDRGRAGTKVEPVEDVADFERPQADDDPAVSKLDQAYAARAFAGLPERWQAVLWHTEVEGESAAQVAPLLGLNPNAVSAIAYRARERLRQLYLQQHLAAVEGKECRWVTERLGAYVRDKLANRESGRVREHLDECDACRIVYLDLVEVNSGFRFLLAPIVLGTAATPYLAAAGKAGAILGFLPGAWGWLRKTTRNPATGIAAAVVLALVLGVTAWATVGADLFDRDKPRAQPTSQGGGGTGQPGSNSQQPATSEPSSSTSEVATTKKPSKKPSEEPTEPPSSAEPTTEPSSRPAETEPSEPEPTTSRPRPTTSKPKPPPAEPTPPQPTTTPPSAEPPPDDPPRGLCVRLPVLHICLGGNSRP